MSKRKGHLERVDTSSLEYDDSDSTVVQGVQNLTLDTGKRQAYIIVISGSSAGKMFKLIERMFIGRSSRCEIQIGDRGISRKHAILECDEKGNTTITDLNSTNGTYYDGKRITQRTLKDGDKIQIGTTTILKYSHQDVVEEAFLKHQYDVATKDGLTGIYNKRFFLEQLGKDFSYANRHREYLSLILFDIDYFKGINDNYGHPAGDQVLREVVRLVSLALRKEDLFARIGGEEFGIILRQVDQAHSYQLAERIRCIIGENDFRWEKKHFHVTISVGLATLDQENFTTSAALFGKADERLYRAKNTGRNRVSS